MASLERALRAFLIFFFLGGGITNGFENFFLGRVLYILYTHTHTHKHTHTHTHTHTHIHNGRLVMVWRHFENATQVKGFYTKHTHTHIHTHTHTHTHPHHTHTHTHTDTHTHTHTHIHTHTHTHTHTPNKQTYIHTTQKLKKTYIQTQHCRFWAKSYIMEDVTQVVSWSPPPPPTVRTNEHRKRVPWCRPLVVHPRRL